MHRRVRWPRAIDRLLQRASGEVADAVMARHGGHTPPDRRLTYSALGVLEARFGWRNHSLAAAELRVFSQNGEDGVLAEIFARIGTTNRYFVEFGIESSIEGNAVLLADVLGWAGLFMEGDELHFAKLSAKYANAGSIITLHAMVGPDNVDALFERAAVPDVPDLLSIDVDGIDYLIWEALSAARPRVIVIEYNSALPPDSRLVADAKQVDPSGWDRTSYFGCSLGARLDVASKRGYRLAHLEMTGVNAFFVREEDWAALRIDEVGMRSPNYFLHGAAHWLIAARGRAWMMTSLRCASGGRAG